MKREVREIHQDGVLPQGEIGPDPSPGGRKEGQRKGDLIQKERNALR